MTRVQKNPISKEGFNAWYQGFHPLTVFNKSWTFGRSKITTEWRRKENAMGRFGGGWNWIVGIQCAPSTTIVNLLVMSVKFNRLPLCEHCHQPADYPRLHKQKPGHYGYAVKDFGEYHDACWKQLNPEGDSK